MKRPPSIVPAPAVNLPVLAEAAALGELRPASGMLARAWEWIRSRQLARHGGRRLQVAETVSLGEKRFVAVVQVDGRHFLLAGGPTNIALLAQLDGKQTFDKVLKETMTVTEKPVRKSRRRSAPAAKKRKTSSKSHPGVNAQPPAQAASAFATVLSNTIAAADKKPRKRRRGRSLPEDKVADVKPQAAVLPGTDNLQQRLKESPTTLQPSPNRPTKRAAKVTAAKATLHRGTGNRNEREVEQTPLAAPSARQGNNLTLEDYA